MHVCEVCFCNMDEHAPCPVDGCTGGFAPPCCPGCGCGSFEEYHPSEENHAPEEFDL